jgi:hypothetical protein
MTALRGRMREDLPLRGLAPRTPQCSLAAVTHLAQHYRRAPDQLREAALRPSFRSLRNAKQGAERT